MKNNESLLDEIKAKIQAHDKPYYIPSFLVKIGLFGTNESVRKALIRGEIPYMEITPRRRIIRKEDILEYVENKFKRSVKISKEASRDDKEFRFYLGEQWDEKERQKLLEQRGKYEELYSVYTTIPLHCLKYLSDLVLEKRLEGKKNVTVAGVLREILVPVLEARM